MLKGLKEGQSNIRHKNTKSIASVAHLHNRDFVIDWKVLDLLTPDDTV